MQIHPHRSPSDARHGLKQIGTDEQVHSPAKIANVVGALKDMGVPPDESLRGSKVSVNQLYSARSRVSLNQVIEVYANAVRLAPQVGFAYRTGLRFHVSSYQLYGFAILSSHDFRQTMQIAVQYHQLATPLADIFFRETDASGVWTIAPISHPIVDADLYKFIVEMQFGHTVCLHRDFMGTAFAPSELHVTFGKPRAAGAYAEALGCDVVFAQPENRLIFDVHWLDSPAVLGNPITSPAVVEMCAALLEQLELRSGMAGKVREVLLSSIGHDASLVAVSERLKIPQRTLRRRLREEGISFREICF
jgi:hypothetical protein